MEEEKEIHSLNRAEKKKDIVGIENKEKEKLKYRIKKRKKQPERE
jgi:hypothetical protein